MQELPDEFCAVHGFRTDDPSQSVEHHVMRGARNALIGAGVGTGVGAFANTR